MTDKKFKIFTSGTVKEVEKRLAAGEDVNAVDAPLNWTGLHFAIEFSNFPVVQCLLKHDANPNAQDKLGQSPLHVAVDLAVEDALDYWNSESIALIALLLTKGANPKLADNNARTPLDWARSKDYETAIKLMGKFV